MKVQLSPKQSFKLLNDGSTIVLKTCSAMQVYLIIFFSFCTIAFKI